MKPIMALDADGVMLDYNLAYARAWERHFGETLIELDPHAYWAIDRFNARHLEGDELKGFETAFDEEISDGLIGVDSYADFGVDEPFGLLGFETDELGRIIRTKE